MDSSVATREPDWLVERRAKAVEAASDLALPGPKVRGWEFTDLSKLDLVRLRAG